MGTTSTNRNPSCIPGCAELAWETTSLWLTSDTPKTEGQCPLCPFQPRSVPEGEPGELQCACTTALYERGYSTALLKLAAVSADCRIAGRSPNATGWDILEYFSPNSGRENLKTFLQRLSMTNDAVWYLEVTGLLIWPCHTFSTTSQGFCLLQECSSTHHRNSTC